MINEVSSVSPKSESNKLEAYKSGHDCRRCGLSEKKIVELTKMKEDREAEVEKIRSESEKNKTKVLHLDDCRTHIAPPERQHSFNSYLNFANNQAPQSSFH